MVDICTTGRIRRHNRRRTRMSITNQQVIEALDGNEVYDGNIIAFVYRYGSRDESVIAQQSRSFIYGLAVGILSSKGLVSETATEDATTVFSVVDLDIEATEFAVGIRANFDENTVNQLIETLKVEVENANGS
jgi:hypothetical protein